MSQLISNLSVGSKIWVTENSTDVLYELAGFNVHGAGTATFVRASTDGLTTWGPQVDEPPPTYGTSVLDASLQDKESDYTIYHRGSLVSVALECVLADTSKEILSRRVFALSDTEVTGNAAHWGGYENSQLSRYTTASNRIKHDDSNVSVNVIWWLRTLASKGSTYWFCRSVAVDGAIANSAQQTSWNIYAVPAFALPSTLSASDATTSGGYTVTYPDTIPQAVPLSPINSYIDVGAAITFTWEHVNFTGTDQAQADLQYRIGSGEWQSLTTVMGATAYATIAANTFPAGQLWWRVRTYNADDVAGGWSTATAFVGVGVPASPTITNVSQCSRPVVNWNSLGQVAYQIQIGDYDTGEVAGTVKTYKLPHYIPNDTYAVRLRVKNASLLWSAWVETTLVLNVTGPTKPSLTATHSNGLVLITPTSTGAEFLYLLRDGVPIADITESATHTDYAALGSVLYVLRSVDEDDNYTDSDAANVTVTVPNATLAAVDALSAQIALMLTRGEPTRLTGSINQNVTYRHYAGRTAPVAVYSGQESESYQIAVAFLQTTDRDNLITLIRRCKTLLYRDGWGNRWYVSISSVGCDQDGIATTMKLNMTVVDYVEAVEYGTA